MTPPAVPDPVPLCVDLDGTLIKSDTLYESAAALLTSSPLKLLAVSTSLLGGKARLKARMAEAVPLDTTALPYTDDLLDFLREQKAAGRTLILVTAADARNARAVADHVGLFDEVLASDGAVNLRGRNKVAALVARFGAKGYDYVGNDATDVAVWRECRTAFVANGSRAVRAKAAAVATVGAEFGGRKPLLKAVTKALRVHQWVKNVLVFVPLVAAHKYGELARLLDVLVYFVAFSLTASSLYVLNDLFDLAADRKHPTKRRRPFAAGDLPVSWGMVGGPLLLLGGLAVGFAVSVTAGIVLAFYAALTLTYSAVLKRLALIDVFVLAAFYMIRIIGGGTASGIVASEWLLGFSWFFFLSLGFLKRVTELMRVRDKHGADGHTRGYRVSDLDLLSRFGIASGFASALVLALYVRSPMGVAVYATPEVLLASVPLLLLWVCRLWLHTERGRMHDDPIVFALKDRASWAILGLLAVTVGVARLAHF